MDESSQKVKIVIALVASFLILIMTGFVINIMNSVKPVILYNIDQIDSGLSESEVDDLENYIWRNLKDSQGYNNDKNTIEVLIRPSSFQKKVAMYDIISYNFLVDVDKFKVTYEVSFTLSGDEGFYEAPTITCASISQTKYPNVNCNGRESRVTLEVPSMGFVYKDNLVGGVKKNV